MSDDFLSRWSRRKRGSGADEAPPEDAPRAEAPAEEAAPEESDAEILTRLGLKHPDEMEPGDDFAAFLRAAVPRHLKSIAYRRLWRSNPTLACLDGLNDYDGDFTGTGVPEGGLKTSYEVGRGILRRIVELPDDAREADPGDPAGSEAPIEAEEQIAAVDEVAPDGVENAERRESVQQDDAPRTARRRMVFRPKG